MASRQELIYDPIGYLFDDTFRRGAYGGHMDHVHFAENFRAHLMVRAIKKALSLGLSVRENPFVDPVDPVHTEGSFHYRDFPGLHHGKRLGEAIDVSGADAAERKFFRWARRRLTGDGAPAGGKNRGHSPQAQALLRQLSAPSPMMRPPGPTAPLPSDVLGSLFPRSSPGPPAVTPAGIAPPGATTSDLARQLAALRQTLLG